MRGSAQRTDQDNESKRDEQYLGNLHNALGFCIHQSDSRNLFLKEVLVHRRRAKAEEFQSEDPGGSSEAPLC